MSERGIYLSATESIVDEAGNPTWAFQRRWQDMVDAVDALKAAVEALPETYVAKDTGATAWSPMTGAAIRTSFATYAAPVISSSPTQAEVQAIADALQDATSREKALIDDLLGNGAIK